MIKIFVVIIGVDYCYRVIVGIGFDNRVNILGIVFSLEAIVFI